MHLRPLMVLLPITVAALAGAARPRSAGCFLDQAGNGPPPLGSEVLSLWENDEATGCLRADGSILFPVRGKKVEDGKVLEASSETCETEGHEVDGRFVLFGLDGEPFASLPMPADGEYRLARIQGREAVLELHGSPNQGTRRTMLFDTEQQRVVLDLPGRVFTLGDLFVAQGTLYDRGGLTAPLDLVPEGEFWGIVDHDADSVTVERPDGVFRLGFDGALERLPTEWLVELKHRRQEEAVTTRSPRGSTVTRAAVDTFQVNPVGGRSFTVAFRRRGLQFCGASPHWYEIDGEEWLGHGGSPTLCHLATAQCFDTSTFVQVFDDGRVVMASEDGGFELRRLISPGRRSSP